MTSVRRTLPSPQERAPSGTPSNVSCTDAACSSEALQAVFERHSAAISAVGKRVNLRADEPLYIDRAPADYFYLLTSGRVRADAVPWPAGTGVAPPPLETPALLGASSFLSRTARRETVRADGPVSLIAIGPQELEARGGRIRPLCARGPCPLSPL